MTRVIHLRNVTIGGGAMPAIQSMNNTDTGDAQASLAQIERLKAAGCQITRLAVPRQEVVDSFREICRQSPLPVIADIHFDYRLALAALEAGADGVRVNPGNIRDLDGVRQVARRAAELGKVVRIGVNNGSLDPAIEAEFGRTPEGLVRSAEKFIGLFEAEGCTELKVSLKASDMRLTLAANRLFAQRSDIPLHIGLTEAGTPETGILKSAIAIGSLFLDGIGDTFRVSLTAPPEEEVVAARKILRAVGLDRSQPELISCPTCGRTRIGLIELAKAVQAELDRLYAEGYSVNFRKIAIMGCEVNGPGEAKEADIGIAGGLEKGLLFRFGQPVKTLPAAELLPTFLQILRDNSTKRE